MSEEHKGVAQVVKSFIARYTDGSTRRIDAPTKKAALEQAKQVKLEYGGRLKKLVPMDEEWMFKIR